MYRTAAVQLVVIRSVGKQLRLEVAALPRFHTLTRLSLHRGPAHGDIFRIFPSGSSHVRGQQCTVAIEEKRFSHRGAATQAVILKTVCLL